LTSTATLLPVPTTSLAPPPTAPQDPVSFQVRTTDGITLSGSLYLPAGAGPFPGVVLSHAGGASQEAWDGLPAALQEAGYVVVTFDFRGHGQSAGILDPPHASLDLAAVLQAMRDDTAVKGDRIALVGASMGGMASVIVAADDPGIAAVIAVSTSPDAAGQNAGEVVGQLSPRPFLAVGCEDDPLTRAERVRQLYELAGLPKRLVLLPCEVHANEILGTSSGPQLIGLILEWLDLYLR
jgi:pimeloyl-ACP methyl ester carboxylesterase